MTPGTRPATAARLLILLASMLLFLPGLGAVHLFDWDEINFAECAREMIASGDYLTVQINFQPFWEKPPLFIWMQAACMSLFGINEFAARLPNAVCGMVTLQVLYALGCRQAGSRFGLWWMLAYVCSFLPHLYFKSGIIDPWFNLFIFLAVHQFSMYVSGAKQIRHLLLSAVFISLATLTKGPVALLVMGLCLLVYYVITRFRQFPPLRHLLAFVAVVVVVGGAWFWMLMATGHTAVIGDFFSYQMRLLQTGDAGHSGPIYYHGVVLLAGCFPMSVFALQAFGSNSPTEYPHHHFARLMKMLFWVVLILFSIVKTKILHYSSLCYFPLSYLAASWLQRYSFGQVRWQKTVSIPFIFLAALLAVALVSASTIELFKHRLLASGLLHDPFAAASLQASVPWNGTEWLSGLLLPAGLLLVWAYRKRLGRSYSLLSMLGVCLATISTAMVAIVPRIEPYSQGAAVQFYQSLAGKDCYVETIGYKSYAHLFYQQKPAGLPHLSREQLLAQPVNKRVYFASKITELNSIQTHHPHLRELYRKNGFVFWVRDD